MEEKNVTIMSIGIGKLLDQEKLKKMATSGYISKNTAKLDNFSDLTEPDTQRVIFEQFCGAHIIYNVSILLTIYLKASTLQIYSALDHWRSQDFLRKSEVI